MEDEKKILIEAWQICSAGNKKDHTSYQKAFEFIENFKKTSSFALDIGFELSHLHANYELAHFGLHLVTGVIRFRWNSMDVETKNRIKNMLMQLIANNESATPNFYKNNLCLTFLELVKREWPQNWPMLLDELFQLSQKSTEQKHVVFTIFRLF